MIYSLLLFSLSLIFLSSCSSPPHGLKSEIKKQIISKPFKTRPDIHIKAVGDLMLGTNFPDDRRAPADGVHLLKATTSILKDADITFGNLEGVLLEGGEAAKKCKSALSCYVFRSPPYYAQYLKDAGFDVISLANNHARDFGEEGRTASMEALDVVGLRHTGRVGDVAHWEVKGSPITWVAYAPFGDSHDLLDIPLAINHIKKLSKTSDIVVVSIHAGAEGKDVEHIPFKNEFFYGEDRGDVVAFSHAVIDAGADLVIGHGPHVPRALEHYKNRLIAYSLGNFLTYQGIKITGKNGLAPILSVTLAASGKFKHAQIISARQFRPEGTKLDSNGEAARLIEELTKQDFPNTSLIFLKNGKIIPKPVVAKKTRHSPLKDVITD